MLVATWYFMPKTATGLRSKTSRGHLNIKMLSYQFRYSHYFDKMISQPYHLYNGNTHTWKDCLYIKMAPCISTLWVNYGIFFVCVRRNIIKRYHKYILKRKFTLKEHVHKCNDLWFAMNNALLDTFKGIHQWLLLVKSCGAMGYNMTLLDQPFTFHGILCPSHTKPE